MLGERLNKANEIAAKRLKRWRHDNDWYQTYYERLFGPIYEPILGHYRKGNGASCSCIMCRGPRYKDKGFNKRRRILLAR